METGKVKFYNTLKNYGYIKNERDGRDYYFTFNDCTDLVSPGDRVSFEIGNSPRGPKAKTVTAI